MKGQRKRNGNCRQFPALHTRSFMIGFPGNHVLSRHPPMACNPHPATSYLTPKGHSTTALARIGSERNSRLLIDVFEANCELLNQDIMD